MISISLRGLDEVVEKIKAIPTALGRDTVFDGATKEFTVLLASKTPPGYSGRLGRSVLSASVDGGSVVGFDEGVETAGDSALDGRRKSRKRRRRWVSVDELETVLMASADEYMGSFEGSVLEAASRGIP